MMAVCAAGAAHTAGLVRRMGSALAFLLIVASSLVGVEAPSQSPAPSCPASRVQGGHDYHGLTLTKCNFNGRDLTRADFRGATLDAVVFVNADLTDADFSGATIVDSGSKTLPTDFSFANLTRTKFIGTRFNGRTYLTHATLVCTDFSQTDISQGNAIFGDYELKLGAAQGCRTRFQQATMNCEFIAQWNQLDLSRATVSSCATALQTAAGQPGHDFSGAILAGAAFDGLDLTGSKWDGAVVTGASFRGSTLDGATGLARSNLTRTVFSQASLKGVDLSHALLYGAVFDQANLDQATLRGAYLSPCPAPAQCAAASFRGAWLRNVDLSGSHLEYAVFNNANFYGTVGAGGGSCDTRSGYCASANGATLTQTDFSDAYLFGVDFGNAQMYGAKFDGAVLVAANFAGATVAAAPDQTNGSFANAFLQGADLSGARVDSVTLSGAFVDFSANGNTMLIRLNSNHTRFAGWSLRGQAVCTRVTYGTPTRVPSIQAGLTCPDNTMASAVGGCGPAAPNVAPTSHWNNGNGIAGADPAASYRLPATFTAASPDLCTADPNW